MAERTAKADTNMHTKRTKTAMLAGISGAKQVEKSFQNISRNSKSNGRSLGKYGRLDAIQGFKAMKIWWALCKCDCGVLKKVRLSHLRSGKTLSCGCLRRDNSRLLGLANTRHGHSCPANRSHTYRSWESMRGRCKNLRDSSFDDYGGRGIQVCKRWDKFEHFLADMGERPRGTTLDRKQTDGDYKPSNCCWSVAKIQQRNKRTNRLVEYKGRLVPLVVVSEQTGIPYSRLHDRIVRHNWTVKRAIETPSRAFV